MLYLECPPDTILEDMQIADAVRWADSNPSHEAARHMTVLINQLRELDAALADAPSEEQINERIDEAVDNAKDEWDDEREYALRDTQAALDNANKRVDHLHSQLEAAEARIEDLTQKLRQAQADRLSGKPVEGVTKIQLATSTTEASGITWGGSAFAARTGLAFDIGSNGGGGSA